MEWTAIWKGSHNPILKKGTKINHFFFSPLKPTAEVYLFNTNWASGGIYLRVWILHPEHHPGSEPSDRIFRCFFEWPSDVEIRGEKWPPFWVINGNLTIFKCGSCFRGCLIWMKYLGMKITFEKQQPFFRVGTCCWGRFYRGQTCKYTLRM